MNEEEVSNILNVHYSLWSYRTVVEWDNKFYNTKLSTSSLYNSVLLPNKNGKKMLWITQPLHSSGSQEYGELLIQKETNNGKLCKVTWIVDTYNGKFSYIGRVYTSYDSRSDVTNILIEKYLNGSFVTSYTNEPDFTKEIYV